MADLNDLQAAQSVKIVGSDSAGVEETPVKSDSNGSLHTTIVGNDGLYRAFVDSSGRISVNANVTFPEAIYQDAKALNGASENGNVLGTAITPVTFRWSAPAGQTWFLENITFLLNDNANFASGGFGGGAALSNGIIFNIRTKGTLQALTNVQNNYHIFRVFRNDTFDSTSSALLGTDRTYRGSIDFQRQIPLDGDLGDYFEMQIRDDLTGMTGVFLNGLVWRLNG